jgi:hypothetical protein
MDETKDHLERRCPRLGGQVSFGYCRMATDDGSACWKIFDCWWEYFDVVEYLKEHLTEEQFNALANARPQPKMASLVDLIQQAKKRTAAGNR